MFKSFKQISNNKGIELFNNIAFVVAAKVYDWVKTISFWPTSKDFKAKKSAELPEFIERLNFELVTFLASFSKEFLKYP